MTTKHIQDRRRELQEKYNSNRFWPLSKRQAERFHAAAVEATELFERFVGLTLLYTGMRNGELCHMRRDWCEDGTLEGGGSLKIEVPVADVCTGGSGPNGEDNAEGANLRDRGAVCSHCRGQDRDHWTPKTDNGDRSITVKEEDPRDIIRWWFEQHEEVPRMHNAVNRRIKRITKRAEIKRKVTAHDLRDTFATMLVRKGFHPNVIRATMGHNDTARLNDYFDFVGLHQERAFDEKW